MKHKEPKTSSKGDTSPDIAITPNPSTEGHENTQTHNTRLDVPLSKLANPVKRIGISSQNFRTITGHAGKARRFLLYEASEYGQVKETGRLELPKTMSMHEFHGDEHPLFGLDVVVTGSCGEGFIRRLGDRAVTVIATSETDPIQAATRIASGKPLAPTQGH